MEETRVDERVSVGSVHCGLSVFPISQSRITGQHTGTEIHLIRDNSTPLYDTPNGLQLKQPKHDHSQDNEPCEEWQAEEV